MSHLEKLPRFRGKIAWHRVCNRLCRFPYELRNNMGSAGKFLAFLAVVSAFAVPAPAPADPKVIKLATTTSTESSGLLHFLLPAFERATGYRVHVIAVGTGKALRMGRDGDVDLVLVHARADEDKFVAAGYGVNRHDLMYNDFVIAVNPARYPDVNYPGAMALIAWLTSAEGQNTIAAYRVDGQSLFFPVATQARQARPYE